MKSFHRLKVFRLKAEGNKEADSAGFVYDSPFLDLELPGTRSEGRGQSTQQDVKSN